MLTTADLTQMQAVQNASMIDTCVIVTNTVTTGAYGGQTQTAVESAPTKCGLSFAAISGRPSSGILNTARGPVPAVDAVCRLPVGTVLNATSQIRVTHRNGVAITPQTYTIEGPVMTGRTCLIVGLKRLGV